MPSLIDLRRRIRSVQNTEQITKAMKMVSAAKLRRAQQAVVNGRPYAGMLDAMSDGLLRRGLGDESVSAHPLAERRECRAVLLLVFAGERGLCGSFNSSVLKASQQFAADRPGQGVEYELLGRKAVDYFSRRECDVSGRWEQVLAKVERSTAEEVAGKAMERFQEGAVDEVWMLFNRFMNVLNQDVTLERLLPVQPAEDESGDADATEFEFEQPPAEVLAELLPKRVVTKVHLAMLDSAAAEHAARMTAMDSATRNAGEVLDKLRLHLNRVRQASITTEIIEIVSGAAALE